MSTTYGQFISEIRGRVWPPGNAEADNLVASHNKDFIDALIDLQTAVLCLQQDNTDIYPQCSTTYKCGLTVIPQPRGIIRKLSVIDKIDPTTHLESATAADDYCSEIAYSEIDFCHIQRYLAMSHKNGWCPNLGLWFGLGCCDFSPWFGTFHRNYPTPTDEGVPAGLPPLPLGFHYPQTSTDSTRRAYHGVWAKDRGNIYIAPWIQSTESILLKWDGIKRSWNPPDPIDDDPLLSKAVEYYARWQHAMKWDKDEQAAADALAGYADARRELIHQCREETRQRACEPSLARASSVGLSSLYYNDDQSYTAQCPANQTGDPVTVTIQAGTVGSNVSVADANQKALTQARTQATAQLVCVATPTVHYNTVAGDAYGSGCEQIDTDAPTPTAGPPIHVIVPIGTVSSTVSVADANTKAQTQAQEQADAQQVCTYYNSAQTATKACADGVTGLVTKTVAAGQKSFQSTGVAAQMSAQSMANSLAMEDAKNQAEAAFVGTDCSGGGGGGTVAIYWNDALTVPVQGGPCAPQYGLGQRITVVVTVAAHIFQSGVPGQANIRAQQAARSLGTTIADQKRAQGLCGTFNVNYLDYVT